MGKKAKRKMGHGGPRPGSGRPATGHNFSTTAFSLGAEHREFLQSTAEDWACSMSEALRRILDRVIKQQK